MSGTAQGWEGAAWIHNKDASLVASDPVADLTVNFSETAQILFSAGSVVDTLSSVVDLAVATIEGCDFAGLFLIEDGLVSTPVHTDPIVVEVDALQHLTGEGPCLDAITEQIIFYAEDLSIDERWSHFGPQATSAGIRSVLALPLADEARRRRHQSLCTLSERIRRGRPRQGCDSGVFGNLGTFGRSSP